MAGKKQVKKFYFPQRLKKEMQEIFDYPLTVVEASSGYGKTTAAADYLVRECAADYRCLWYVCLGEPAETAWEGICGRFHSIDSRTACYLRGMAAPDPDAAPSVAIQMMKLQCPEPTLLIVDNFQLADFSSPGRLLDALSLHNCPDFHILVLTQPLPAEKRRFMNPRIKRITADMLAFSAGDIERMFRTAGVGLDRGQADFLWNTTEGLAAALNLQLRNFQIEGCFIQSSILSELMEAAFFSRLARQEQELLIRLSALESFTLRQAAAMLGAERLPERYEPVLKGDFVRFQPSEGRYCFHYLLETFLRMKFDGWCVQEQIHVRLLAGESCAAEGDCAGAARQFVRAGAYEKLLSLPFSPADRYDLVHLDDGMIAEKLIAEPARSLLPDYPELTLSLTLELFIQGKFALHHAYYQLIGRMLLVDGPERYEAKRLKNLLGEFALMESFLVFNDVKRMCERHRQAYELLGTATRLYSLRDAWTFGAPSVVYMFWRESGGLQSGQKEVEAGMPCYYQLSNGQGSGAPEAMKAEILLLAGEEEQAAPLALKAIAKAERAHQESVCFCAELVLARASVLRGDRDAFEDAAARIRHRAFDGYERRSVLTSEVCLAFLNLKLGRYEQIPAWFCQPEAIRRRTLHLAVPFTNIIYGGLMLRGLMEKKLTLAGFERAMLGGIQESEALHTLLPGIYNRIYLAAANDMFGRRKEAMAYLNQALNLALPDRVYLPFAEYYDSVAELLKLRICPPSQKEETAALLALGRRMSTQSRRLGAEAGGRGKVLTERELEIAVLLRQRLTVKEIAVRLKISPSTVSNTMRKIYAKLEIHSRSELVEAGDSRL